MRIKIKRKGILLLLLPIATAMACGGGTDGIWSPHIIKNGQRDFPV